MERSTQNLHLFNVTINSEENEIVSNLKKNLNTRLDLKFISTIIIK